MDDVTETDTQESLSNNDFKGLARTMLVQEGGSTGIVVTVAPTIVFFVIDSLSS